MVYRCECCDFSCSRPAEWTRHCDSKKHQRMSNGAVINKDIMSLISNLQNTIEQTKVEYLSKVKDMDGRVSFLEEENKILKEESNELRKVIENMKPIVNGNNNVVNYTNNNNNYYQITLSKYGTETYPNDIQALTDAVKGVNKAIPELVKLRHFDPRHPENHNIKIPNKKQNKIQIYDGKRWITENKKTTIEEKLQDFTNFMDTPEGQQIYDSCSIMIREKLDKLKDFCDKVYSGDKLNREEQKELRRITGDVENIILDYQSK